MSSVADPHAAEPHPVVTVIVPAYNVADEIDECVSSIVAQSYSALEIILVDDGSTDSTGERCDVWAERDPRIQVIRGPNGGLSVARNKGLDRGSGEFVTFVDADDILAVNHVAHLLDVALRTGARLVSGGLTDFREPISPVFRTYSRIVSHEAGAALEPIVRSGVGFASCGKLIHASVMDVVRFTPGVDFEDLDVLPRLVARAGPVAFTDAATYGYRQRDGSLMDGHRKVLRRSLLDVLASDIAYIRREPALWAGSTPDRLVLGFVLYGVRILESASRPEVRREDGYDVSYRRFLRPHLLSLLKSAEISALYRAAILVSWVSPSAFVRSMRVAGVVKRRFVPGLKRRS